MTRVDPGLLDPRRWRVAEHPNRVRSVDSDRVLGCCWDDCVQAGDTRFQTDYVEGVKRTTYIFCCEAHRQYWGHSHRELGKLPPGINKRLF